MTCQYQPHLWNGSLQAGDNSAIRLRSNSVAEIWSGELQGERGAGIVASDSAVAHIRDSVTIVEEVGNPQLKATDDAKIHVYGRNLNTDNATITGTFQDGSAIRLSYSTEDSGEIVLCLLYTSPSPRDATLSRMPSSA